MRYHVHIALESTSANLFFSLFKSGPTSWISLALRRKVVLASFAIVGKTWAHPQGGVGSPKLATTNQSWMHVNSLRGRMGKEDGFRAPSGGGRQSSPGCGRAVLQANCGRSRRSKPSRGWTGVVGGTGYHPYEI